MKVVLYGAWHVHAAGYVKLAQNHAEVIGFWEQDDSLAEKFMKACPDLPRFASAEDLLRSDADGVIVCSATSDHGRDIVAIANAGKDIFTEKVLALTNEECEAIDKAVSKNGVRFVISYPQKFQSVGRTAKAVADSGELGRISFVRYRNAHSGSVRDWLPSHFYSESQCGGGAMIDLGAHGMYMLHWLLGEPISARSAFTVFCNEGGAAEKNVDKVEDNAVTVMTYPDGAIGVNETGFVTDKAAVVFEIHGERGYVIAEKDTVRKCSVDTEGKAVEVELLAAEDAPLVQFLRGEAPAGCGMEEAKALTRIMTMAYGNT